MASSGFSHQKNLSSLIPRKPGTNLGESASQQSGLEANDAMHAPLSPKQEASPYHDGIGQSSVPSPALTLNCRDDKARQKPFVNGWFCKRCGATTEHKHVKGQEICLECGESLGKPQSYFQRADVKAKQRAYSQRADVKAKQRAYSQRADVKAKKRAYSQRADVKAKQRAKKIQKRIKNLEQTLSKLRAEASQ